MPKPFVINITIDGQRFQSADPVRCHPARRLIFMINNEDAQSYDVTIDPTIDIFEKEDVGVPGAVPVNPTTAAAPVTVTVTGSNTPGSSKPIKFMLKPKAQFGKAPGLVRYTTYKYTVHGNVTGTANILVDLDPDFDVTPP